MFFRNMLPKQAIDEFKLIYLEEEGIVLSDEEAIEKATALLGVFKVLIKPYKKNEGSIIVRSVGLTKKGK